MERTITIRFSHIDGASIVFYPRYFEMVGELFADLPFTTPPFSMRTEFLRPNVLGDELTVDYQTGKSSGDWRLTGRMNGQEHFQINPLGTESPLDAAAHRPDQPAFQSDVMQIAPWTTDCTGQLQVSRYYELQNAAVEQWFPRTLATSFYEFHIEDGYGMPTVVMRTQCRELPRAGDTVTIWIRPTRIGEKSANYTCWLVRDGKCLLTNEQTIVFVETDGPRFKTIPIPDGIRERLQEQYVAA